MLHPCDFPEPRAHDPQARIVDDPRREARGVCNGVVFAGALWLLHGLLGACLYWLWGG